MGGSKGLAVLVSAACIVILAAAPAHAVVTPRAFGNCKRADAGRAVRATNLVQLVDQDLNSSPRTPPFVYPVSPRSQFSGCRDLNGDGRRDLVVVIGIEGATMKGMLDLTLGPVGFTGDLAGFVDGLRAFSAEGKGTVGFKGKGLGGEGLVSSMGIAACGKALLLKGGFGVRWDEFPKPTIMAFSCGLDRWRVSPAASASQTSRSIRVRRGSGQLTLSVVGRGAPPAVTLHGPGGVAVSAPAQGATLERGRLAFRNPDDVTTYFAIGRPRPGGWTLTTEPGSAPIAQYRLSFELPPVRVRARVRGRGPVRTLRWRVSRRHGLRVDFLERSGAGVRRIAVARGGRGSARFRPAATRKPRRRIVALIARRGLPEARRTVTRFRARTPRMTRPRRLAVGRRGSRAIVRYGGARGAKRIELRVRISDGRTLLFLRRRAGVVRVGGVARRDRVTATLRGLDSGGRPGPARRARLR